MVKAGSGVITQGLADSAGVPATVAADTLVIPLGDIAALERAFAEAGKDIAAAIIEPLPANNGLLIQSREWLQRQNGYAVASLVLGIFSLIELGVIPLFSLGAVVTGIIGLKQLRSPEGERTQGKKLATAGLILGVISLVIGITLYSIRPGS